MDCYDISQLSLFLAANDKRLSHLIYGHRMVTDALSSFLSSNGISVVSCYLAKLADAESDDTDNAATRNTRRAREFVSMRVCVYQTDMSKIMCADLWPEGVTVRPWVFKNKA